MLSLLVITLLAGGLLLLAMRRRRPAWEAALCDPLPRVPGSRWGGIWLALGLALVALALGLLEYRQPYYFSQDDVLVGELPGTLWQCRSAWEGRVPEYNPYVLLGAPALSEGSGGTYPPTYLAYAIARHVLGDEYATLEVFAALHLLAGFAAAYWAARQAGMGPMPACAAAVSLVLSGSVLVMGRSWHTFLPLVLWTPLLVAAVAKLSAGPVSWKWSLATAAVLGIAYHGEFLQVWAYSVLFLVLATAWLVLMGRIPPRRGLQLIPAVLMGLALAAPLVWVQAALAADMTHSGGYGCGIADGLAAMLLPYPLARAGHPNGWGSTELAYMGHLYYFGTLLLLLFVAQVLVWFTARPRRAVWAEQVWTVAACVAFLLALGPAGGLWLVLGKLPVFGSINNHPFRLLPFFVLFAVLSGGLFLERLLRLAARRRAWEIGLGVVLGGLLVYHVVMARASFYAYGFRPYPNLPAELAAMLTGEEAGEKGMSPISGSGPAGASRQLERWGYASPQRLAAWAPNRSIVPSYALALPHNLPAVYRLPAFGGYDPVVENKPPFQFAEERMRQEPAAAARAYGVRWLLEHRTGREPVFSPNPNLREMEQSVRLDGAFRRIDLVHVHRLAGLDDLTVGEVGGVAPLAFANGVRGEGRGTRDECRSLPLRLHGGGIDVDLRGLAAAGAVTVNFLWYPEMTAAVDGRPVLCRRDEWQRIVADVPAGARELAVRYRPDWARGIVAGGLLLGLGLAGAAALRRCNRSPETVSIGRRGTDAL
ncbi:MAG: hypothetical protein ABSF26_17135 [Thermoguttaceae bacterium]